MNANRIEEFIDNKIYGFLSSGESYTFVVDTLKDSISKFIYKESFIPVSRKYLINNWSQIPLKKRYTTYYVMYSKKRINDIEWIIKSQKKFPTYQRTKMFSLIKLKDKLS